MYLKITLVFILIFFIVDSKVSNGGIDSAIVHNETFYIGFTPLDSSYSLTKLSNSLNAVIANNGKNLGSTNFGIGVYSLNQKKWYYSRNADKLLTPASTTKLFTTYTLLRQIGSEAYISTEVYHDGTIQPDGIIKGNIYIYGKGDALFSTSDLEVLADKVRKSGIRKITGNVYSDGTFYDDETERIVYSRDKDVVQATPPIAALNIDRNAATIIVKAGPRAGDPPSVQVIPFSDSHIIINNAKVGTVKSKKAGIRVNTKMLPDGRQQFITSGNIKPNSTFTYQHLIHNPPLTIAGAFKNRLKAGGIVIDGDFGVVSRAESDSIKSDYKYIADFKRPVFDIINPVNKDSDNYLAEILFKMIGANYGNRHDNAPSTRKFMDSLFTKDNIECNKCKLNDGSGLSRRNVVTTESLIGILNNATYYEFYDDFKNSLSIAGEDGTLRKRMKGTNAEKNLLGKTGTLRNVSALAGYVRTLDGDNLVFAFIFNGPNVGVYKLIENELSKILSDFYFETVPLDNPAGR
ncbi:MAG: D-alanyl-D-alanine carboxypeptidase/D-alanyl-D-alanine-endopeptidase [Candidatus Kapabacteria bacterium]|nr:D-alanyl-D-alanine carboxypeptidase/D-alanyl-D-alanine-endopeptidase [Ignavibacteriota bacterium]MCW5884965.1 D-alanyl-D-alanine carboxypeptidase/D-alanyl-D-alanine-endopeptidase [Candidatus Kapabacteria bacterium]